MTASFPGAIKSFGSDRVNGDYIPASDMNDVRAEVVAIETAALAGWLEQSEAWTYASASTFKVVGDRTAFYTKGRRLRWKHALSYRYGVVASSSYGAPDTTVTILVNVDYVVANSAISSQAVSDLDNPPGWPGWFSWLPTYTGSGSLTFAGVTTNLAKYNVSGRIVNFLLRASGTTGGTAHTSIRASCPVTPVVSVELNFTCLVPDTYLGFGVVDTANARLAFGRSDGANYSLGAARVIMGSGFYEW